MASDVGVLMFQLAETISTQLDWDEYKRQVFDRVLGALPNELLDMNSNFKEWQTNEVVHSKNDFLLGIVIALIYCNFNHICSLEGNPLKGDQIPRFLTSLYSNSTRLMQILSKLQG